jgi:hypothetical protein
MTTPPPGPPSREGWRHHARAIVAERLGLKVTATVVAVLLWFVVRVIRVAGGAS